MSFIEVLEIFAEAQSVAHHWRDSRQHELILSIRRRKAIDNAEQHRKRMADPAKRARVLERKRAAYQRRKARRTAA